jgi:hypothetical protein
VTHGPNPSIVGEAIRKAVGSNEVQAARRRDGAAERAKLDAAELRELERAEGYGGAADRSVPTAKRNLLARLFGR